MSGGVSVRDASHRIGGLVMDTYLPGHPARILEIGPQNITGALRDHSPRNAEYVHLGFEQGPGVDKVITSCRDWNVPDTYFDLVISSSAFQHDKAFWLTFAEMCKKTRAGGHVYVCAPSNGEVDRRPMDYWRFYPDSGLALEECGRSAGFNITLIESFITKREAEENNVFCAVFRVGVSAAELNRDFVHKRTQSTNAVNWRSSLVISPTLNFEDTPIPVAAYEKLNVGFAATIEDLCVQHANEIERLKTELEAQEKRHAAELLQFKDVVAEVAEERVARSISERRLQQCFLEIAELTRLLQADNDATETQRSQDQDTDLASQLTVINAALEIERAARFTLDNQLQDRFREITALTRVIQERDQIIDRTREQAEWLRLVVSGLTRDLSKSTKARFAALLPTYFKHVQQQAWLKDQGLFDPDVYVTLYPEVAASNVDPLRHYVNHGMKEGRVIRLER